jgi:calnexin
MQNGFLFDNIYVGHSEADAKALAEETWAVKRSLEKAAEPEPAVDGDSYTDKAKGLLQKAKIQAAELQSQIQDFVNLAKEDFVGAVKELPHIAGILLLGALIPLVFLTSLFSSSSPAPKKKEKKGDEAEKPVKEEASASGVESSKATKRVTKKD